LKNPSVHFADCQSDILSLKNSDQHNHFLITTGRSLKSARTYGETFAHTH
jgi:hypothetical protein